MAQIGTIKLQTGSGVVELPVFETADAGDNVYDMMRVQTPSGVGFVPLVNTSDASYPYLRVQSQSGGVLAAHNEPALGFNDDFSTFDSNTWNLYGDATYDSANNRVELNSGTGGTGGTLEYEPGITSVWSTDVTFTNGADGADEVRVLFKYNALDGSDSSSVWFPNDVGYAVDFDHWNDKISISEYSGGSETEVASVNQSIGAGTFTGTVEYDNGAVTVYFEGTQVLSHTFSSTNSYTSFGYAGRDGGTTGAHYIEDVRITGSGTGANGGGVIT